jgi:hypothetical protein
MTPQMALDMLVAMKKQYLAGITIVREENDSRSHEV